MSKRFTLALGTAVSALALSLSLSAAPPAFAQDAAWPPPAGMARPMFERTAMVAPPMFFCSERARSDFLLDVYYPAAQKASRNRIAAHTYLVSLRRSRDAARAAGDAKAEASYQKAFDDWEPTWKEADKLADALYHLRDAIELIPTIACAPGMAMATPAKGAFAAALQTARGASPVNRIGTTAQSYGMAMADRSFDGSEAQYGAQVAMGAVMVQPRRDRQPTPTAAIPPASGEPALTTPPQASEALLVVDEPAKPAPPIELAGQTTLPINNGPVVQPQPVTAILPPPPPAQPFYPDCPEHPGMPGTPEHIRLYHGG